MNNFIKPQLIDYSNRIAEAEQMLLEHSDNLQEAHSLYAELEGKISIAKNASEKEATQFLKMKEQLAFGGFLNVCMMELIVASKNLLQAKQKWEELYHVRHIYLTIYEAINTYNGYNKWLKKTIENKYTILLSAFNKISSRLRKFKKDFEYDTTIAEIRNQTTAHIIKDFTDFFQKINSIDIAKAKQALVEFVHILNLMEKLITDIGLQSFLDMLRKSPDFRTLLDNETNTILQRFDEKVKSFNGGN